MVVCFFCWPLHTACPRTQHYFFTTRETIQNTRVLVKLARRVSFACVLHANSTPPISNPTHINKCILFQIKKESPLILLQDDFFYFTSLTYIFSRKFFFTDSIQNWNNSSQLKESNKRMKQINNKVKECNKKIKEISKQIKESNKKVKDVNKNA